MKPFVALLITSACLLCLLPSQWEGHLLTAANTERPVVNVPFSLRQANWLGPNGQGSCSFAALCSDLQWLGKPDKAHEIRLQCGDGQSPKSLAIEMAKHDIKFAWTVGEQDVAFLEKALATRRGCMVCISGGEHMVLLAHLDDTSAYLIDSNQQGVNRRWSREQFEREWFASGSWAVCVIGTPVPPLAR